ncbi:hypothetical protein [Streptomyces sp. NPDC094466]|uniref:hypothetical protein n=1 Tax=Streptomyces sp. NPDC094466 TaxID=3366065 RepID=UPI003826898A
MSPRSGPPAGPVGAGADERSPPAARAPSPLPGGFSPAPRGVCELAPAAQETAIGVLRPGARFRDFHREAMRVIAERLHARGTLPVPAKEALADDGGPRMARPWTGSRQRRPSSDEAPRNVTLYSAVPHH